MVKQSFPALCLASLVLSAALAASAARPMPRPVLLERINAGLEVYGIVHWGHNTFTDCEWRRGDETPKDLNPDAFDADQIVGACKDGGLQGLIVVAKHHDGFHGAHQGYVQKVRVFYVDPKTLNRVMNATTTNGETDTAQWMTKGTGK